LELKQSVWNSLQSLVYIYKYIYLLGIYKPFSPATAPAAANKYSACEITLMKKFLLCTEEDSACYTAHLQSLGTCLEVCCKDQLQYCQAAVCRGLERSYVDVKAAISLCHDQLFAPIESE
jgi:hypothetical protein